MTVSVAWYRSRLKSMTERYHFARNRWLALQRITTKIYESRLRHDSQVYLNNLLDELEEAAGLR